MNKEACTAHKVHAYLTNTNNNNDLIPLEWWRGNGGKYHNLDRVAQKWLAVPETCSTYVGQWILQNG